MSSKPTEDLIIRSYTANDVAALIDLFRTTVRSINLADYTEDQVRAWAPDTIDETAWSDRLAGDTGFVADIAGSIAGFTELTPQGHVEMLCVAEDRQRRGIATALLERVESEAAGCSLERLMTEASLTARTVFEKHGFTGVERQEVARGGQTLVNFRMAKMHWTTRR